MRAESRIMISCSLRNVADVSLMVIPYEFRVLTRLGSGCTHCAARGPVSAAVAGGLTAGATFGEP
ncbi:hypothetical protein D3C80_1821350 [compost metagenome]